MLPFRKILFPVDYSAPCQAVIPYVQEMAGRFSAELTVCHAYAPLDAIAHSELLVTDPELQAKAQALEEDRLRQFACQNFPGQKLDAIADLGEPGSVIDRLARAARRSGDAGNARPRPAAAIAAGIHHCQSAPRRRLRGVDRGGRRGAGSSRANSLSIHCLRLGR
jgi:hypothetical protein